jgi:hypothetical protein
MHEHSGNGFTGWIVPGLAVVLLSAKLSAAFWPQLTSLATTVRDKAESLFESEEEAPAEPPSEPLSTTPTAAPGVAPIVIEQPTNPRNRQCHRH